MDYRRDNGTENRTSRATGIAVTVAVHAALISAAAFSDLGALTTLYPPPQEQSMLIEFEELAPKAIREKAGREPQSVEVDRTKPMNLVQQSQGQFTGSTQNVAKEATLGPEGDVEMPEPPREKEIDRRALFHSAANKSEKDTLAAQTSEKVSDKLAEGHALGNTAKGNTSGEPNARLKGRSVLGMLPSPSYSVQAEGTVVVDIWVDQYGNVTKAVAGAQGTTLTDATIWAAARAAALKAHFNMSPDAPALQQGTITYNFKLK